MPKDLPSLPMGRIFEEIRKTRSLTNKEICTLRRIEHDERMPAVWNTLASRKFCYEDIKHFLVAILQSENLAQADILDKMLENFRGAAQTVRKLDLFLKQSLLVEQGRFIGDEDGNAIRDIQAWRSTLQKIEVYVAKRRKRYLPAAGQIMPTSQKDNPVALFSINLSRIMEQNFGSPFDEIVSILTSVVFQLPKTVEPETIRKRRVRDAARRSGG
jgi:hypothetical protein